MPCWAADLPNLKTIRIGTKALSYWPYKFLTDADATEMLDVFRRITGSGTHLAIMAHFNHLTELSTGAVREAIRVVRSTGAQIRTQSPVLQNINDDADMWARMWRQQVQMGCIPYYMFAVRDTGGAALLWRAAGEGVQAVPGGLQEGERLGQDRPGSEHVGHTGQGADRRHAHHKRQKVIQLRFLQGRNPDWVQRPFFAEYDEGAIWLDDLKPAFGEESFFFEQEMQEKYALGK